MTIVKRRAANSGDKKKAAREGIMTRWIALRACRGRTARAMAAIVVMAAVCVAGQQAAAQTYGLATMPPGTLANTTGTAIAKV